METEVSAHSNGVETLLSPDQAANLLGVRRRTLEAWVRAGKIPVVKLGRLHKFRPTTLQRFIETQETVANTGIVPLQTVTSVPPVLDNAATDEAVRRQRAITLLEQWNAEDATDDPQEIARREAEWGAFEKSLEENRLSFSGPGGLMLSAIVLDERPLSLAAQSQSKPEALAFRKWMADWIRRGVVFYIPEIIDYELRRELTRATKAESLARLDALPQIGIYLPLTTRHMREAASLWAHVRNLNLTTADKQALDCDVILCAQALSLGLPAEQIVVATSNAAHIGRFLNAAAWADIQPEEG